MTTFTKAPEALAQASSSLRMYRDCLIDELQRILALSAAVWELAGRTGDGRAGAHDPSLLEQHMAAMDLIDSRLAAISQGVHRSFAQIETAARAVEGHGAR